MRKTKEYIYSPKGMRSISCKVAAIDQCMRFLSVFTAHKMIFDSEFLKYPLLLSIHQ